MKNSKKKLIDYTLTLASLLWSVSLLWVVYGLCPQSTILFPLFLWVFVSEVDREELSTVMLDKGQYIMCFELRCESFCFGKDRHIMSAHHINFHLIIVPM